MTVLEAQQENEQMEDRRRIEKVTSYFDTYDLIHEEMKQLGVERDRYPVLSPEAEEFRTQIDALREQAYAQIPYSATTPNKGTDGRRYGRRVNLG